MSPTKVLASSLHSSEIGLSLAELQNETIELVLPLLYVAGFVLAANADRFREPLHGRLAIALLALLPAVVWALRGLDYRAAAWALVIGCLSVDLLVVGAGNVEYAIVLIALPVGLAAVFVSGPAGMVVAAVCTMLLLVSPIAGLDPGLRTAAIAAMWGTVGLAWLVMSPLQTAVEWSWSSHERSRGLLERSREYQALLKPALKDMERANLQLTRLNRLTQALRVEAEDARVAEERFVANVSHELRTPLNMIIGFSEMIVGTPEVYGGHIPAAMLADLDIIYRNSQHLSALIDDVLDLSQIEAGQMALMRERGALHEIIGAAATAVRPLFDSKRLYLETEVPCDLPQVFCDRTRIRQVALNLLSNSGRLTERGGVRVRAWQEGTDVVVSVADTGPGIAAEDMDKVFHRFQQLGGPSPEARGKTGLGLYLSNTFVDAHGGKMWLESTKGVGTTFYFRLPIDPPVAAEGSGFWPLGLYKQRIEGTHSLSTPSTPVRRRFVVVEDGDSLRRLLTRYLDNTEVVPMTSLEEAIHHMSQEPAQALLVNSVNTSETLQQLSESSSLQPGTPALVCAVPGFPEAADGLGVSGYLVKPVSRKTLLASLDRLELRGGTILVVDDEPEALRLFRRMLVTSSRGYRVLGATDGQQALSALCRNHPDVVLLDLVMPNMDGFQFLAAKTRDPSLRDIPVLVVSARNPAGQPILSNSLAITQAGGLPAHQLLECIAAISRILSATGQVGDPVPREELPDPPVCG
jgi:signal transduction histidine kinase/CheY-like chemotaxis protein